MQGKSSRTILHTSVKTRNKLFYFEKIALHFYKNGHLIRRGRLPHLESQKAENDWTICVFFGKVFPFSPSCSLPSPLEHSLKICLVQAQDI